MDRKTLVILLFVTLSVLLFFFVLFLLKTDDSIPCTTLACNDTARQLLHRMDQNVNPCDDFYQFACGGFLNSTDDEYDTEKKLRDKMLEKLRKIIKQNSSVDEPEYLKLAKHFYKQCSLIDIKMDDKFSNNSNSIKPIEIWPALKQNQWNESEFSFNRTIFKVGNTTEWINYFFEFALSFNDYSSIEIYPVSYELTRDQLNQGLNNRKVKNYYNEMMNLSASFYTDASSTIAIVEMIKEILKFETDILNMTLLPEDEWSNGTFDDVEITFVEFQNNYNYFDWERYINYFRDTPVNTTTTKIIIKDIEYLKNLKYLLNSTEKIVQSNYITWKHYRKKFNAINQIHSHDCVSVTMKNLPIAMGAIYYQNYGDSSIEDDVKQIILDIKQQFSDMIINTDWIDDMTKKKAVEKLESLLYLTGYPEEFLNNSIIDEIYRRLKFLEGDDYIDQRIRIDKFNQQILLTQNNKSLWLYWGELVLKYNAYNLPTNNIIILPPVYQDVLFKEKNSNSINYGTLGSTIGHEIGHAFDNEGIYYDENGIKNNWWRNDSLTNFKNRAMCIVEQYDNYTMPEINANVNGTLTLNENIADITGLKAAYRAYIKKFKSSRNRERLSHLSYNSKQLFWISYANDWCKKVTDKDLERVDEHTPSKFRVIGSLSNMQEFSDDFQCPIGSKMNPIRKCTVW